MAAFGDENVGGLDVEVDESLGVGGVEGIGDLGCQSEQGVEFDGLCRRCGASGSCHRGTPWR